MRPELSILSFLCAVLLLGLVFLHWKSQNVAVLALIFWLLLGNIMQGINSVLWSGSTTVHAEVWCDISSKLLIGCRLALSAACTCICVHLHYLSSARHTRLRQYRALIEFMACLIAPIMYMALHTIVQDHRFVVAEDFGCVSSIYTSSPALILVWIPPIILCITSMAYASLALWRHIHRNPLLSSHPGISSRLITVTFLRPLLTAVFTSTFVLAASVFDITAAIASHHGLLPWTSLSDVHANLSQALVLFGLDRLSLTRVEVFWWVVPASTMVFSIMAAIGLVLCPNDGSVAGLHFPRKWLGSTLLRPAGDKDTFIQSSRDLSKRVTLAALSPPLPVHFPDVGWDITLQESARSKPTLPPIVCDMPPTPASPTDSESEYDASFKAATLAYLRSPTGRETLALRSQASSPISGPISQVGSRWSTLLSTPAPVLTSSASPSPAPSILSSPWPRPPSTIPASPISPKKSPVGSTRFNEPAHAVNPAVNRSYARPPSLSSLTGSLASTIDPSACVSDPDIFLHRVDPPTGPAPFQYAGIPSSTPAGPASVPRHPRRVSSKESFIGIKRGAGLRKKEAYGDAVYMTVVHETQAV